MSGLTPEEQAKLDELMKKKQAAEPVAEKTEADSPSESEKKEPSLTEFLFGLFLFGAGFFMVTHNTVIHAGFTLGNLIGFTPPFGVVLLPLLIGIGFLFYDDKSRVGWILSSFGVVVIILGIIMGLRIVFAPISLFEGLIMFGMLFGGAGLLFRVLRKVEL